MSEELVDERIQKYVPKYVRRTYNIGAEYEYTGRFKFRPTVGKSHLVRRNLNHPFTLYIHSYATACVDETSWHTSTYTLIIFIIYYSVKNKKQNSRSSSFSLNVIFRYTYIYAIIRLYVAEQQKMNTLYMGNGYTHIARTNWRAREKKVAFSDFENSKLGVRIE